MSNNVPPKDLRDQFNKLVKEETGLKIKMIENGADGPIYIGMATAGTATSVKKWQVQKLVYTTNELTSVLFAGGHAGFDTAWDDRAEASYS